jgi:hypothetical protein
VCLANQLPLREIRGIVKNRALIQLPIIADRATEEGGNNPFSLFISKIHKRPMNCSSTNHRLIVVILEAKDKAPPKQAMPRLDALIGTSGTVFVLFADVLP